MECLMTLVFNYNFGHKTNLDSNEANDPHLNIYT